MPKTIGGRICLLCCIGLSNSRRKEEEEEEYDSDLTVLVLENDPNLVSYVVTVQ